MANSKFVTKETMKAIYDDMNARIDMGIIDLEHGPTTSFMENAWESITEKIKDDFDCPEDHTAVNVYSTVLGSVTERLMRERVGDDLWW